MNPERKREHSRLRDETKLGTYERLLTLQANAEMRKSALLSYVSAASGNTPLRSLFHYSTCATEFSLGQLLFARDIFGESQDIFVPG
jgi:hypothetical protein